MPMAAAATIGEGGDRVRVVAASMATGLTPAHLVGLRACPAQRWLKTRQLVATLLPCSPDGALTVCPRWLDALRQRRWPAALPVDLIACKEGGLGSVDVILPRSGSLQRTGSCILTANALQRGL